MDIYQVVPVREGGDAAVSVPSSKSIFSRALILAAFHEGKTLLRTGALCADSRTLLGCLSALGIETQENPDGIAVYGGDPAPHAALNVGSSGTAARFLTAALALRGGDYLFDASAQMRARPMDMLPLLDAEGVRFDYLGERGRFPFRLRSEGGFPRSMTADTATSTQFASAFLLAAGLGTQPFTLRLTGPRKENPYLDLTADVLRAFGAQCERREDLFDIIPSHAAPAEYSVPPDLSSACYFYAAALLLRKNILVRGAYADRRQPDFRFLRLLEERGVAFAQTPEGLRADGGTAPHFSGFDVDARDFSDQALTLAALAPFATSPTRLRGIAHIRRQECDRIRAIAENLTALGVPARETADGVEIEPALPHGGTVKTYGDHRVAMAFSLIGLKVDGIRIEDPSCTDKTFPHYFDALEELTR